MKFSFANRIRLFLIVTLTLLVVGMTIFGVLGFNQTVDNKPSYEMQVSVDQIAGDSVEILKTSSESAINNLFDNYSVQEMNEGSVLVYKFSYDVTEKAAEVQASVQTALANCSVSGINANVKVYQNLGNYYSQAGVVILALSIAIVVIFVYALIMNKLAGGVAVVCSSILSVLLFLSIMAITRIPAQPYLAVLCSATAVIASVLALVITTKYKATLKAEEKLTSFEIAENVNNSFRSIYVILGVGLACLAIIAGAIGALSSVFLGLAVLVSGVASMASAVYMTPFIWSLISGKRK